MPLRNFPVADQTGAWDDREVAAYLATNGYQVGLGGLATSIDPATPTTVIVRVDLDSHIPDATVQADLEAFAPDHTPEATAQVAMRQAFGQLAAVEAGTLTLDAAAELAIHRKVILAYGTTLGIGG